MQEASDRRRGSPELGTPGDEGRELTAGEWRVWLDAHAAGAAGGEEDGYRDGWSEGYAGIDLDSGPDVPLPAGNRVGGDVWLAGYLAGRHEGMTRGHAAGYADGRAAGDREAEAAHRVAAAIVMERWDDPAVRAYAQALERDRH